MEKPYSLRNPFPNNYKHVIDNGTEMLECPECECRIQANFFSYAVGDYGYKFCPYCGVDLRVKSQLTIEDFLQKAGEDNACN